MARRLFVTVSLCALVLAIVPSALVSPGVAQSEPAGESMPWELLDCEFVVAFVPVSTPAIQAEVPPGFTVRSIPERWVGEGRATTLLGIESEVCDRGTGLADEGLLDDMAYASIWVAVDPPDALEVEGFQGGYYVNFNPLIPDGDRRQAFLDVGVPAHGGQVSLQPLVTGGGQATVTSSYTLDGFGPFQVDGVVPEDPLSVFSGEFYQWTEADDGDLARWFVAWQMHTFHQGPGTVQVPAGSWLAGLLGAEEVVAPVVYYGTWDYTDGEILLPT